MIPFNVIKETDFHNAWKLALEFILKNKYEISFGDLKNPKKAWDSTQVIWLSGGAIRQIERREIHPDYPFKLVDNYCNELTREYLKNYHKKSDLEKFVYLYFERLVEPIDQLAFMNNNLGKQISSGIRSNQCQAITWRSEEDTISGSPPCLQRIQVLWSEPDQVDVRFSWRSRDLFGAWQSNLIALVSMLNTEVIHPNGCKIRSIIDYSDSLHVYITDLEAARNVRWPIYGRFE